MVKAGAESAAAAAAKVLEPLPSLLFFLPLGSFPLWDGDLPVFWRAPAISDVSGDGLRRLCGDPPLVGPATTDAVFFRCCCCGCFPFFLGEAWGIVLFSAGALSPSGVGTRSVRSTSPPADDEAWDKVGSGVAGLAFLLPGAFLAAGFLVTLGRPLEARLTSDSLPLAVVEAARDPAPAAEDLLLRTDLLLPRVPALEADASRECGSATAAALLFPLDEAADVPLECVWAVW